MKKILGIILLFLITQVFMGCALINTTTTQDTTVAERMSIRQDLLDFILVFGDAQYEDDAAPYDKNYLYGNADAVVVEADDSIGMLFVEEHTILMVTFYLDPGTPSDTLVWEIDFDYMDTVSQVYLTLEYYHYNEFLQEDYRPEEIGKSLRLLSEDLALLTIEDIRWILTELGYADVNLTEPY